MPTINAVKRADVQTISEVLEIIKRVGAEKVVIKDFDIQTECSFDEFVLLMNVVNTESIKNVIENVFNNNSLMERIRGDKPRTEVVAFLCELAIQRKAKVAIDKEIGIVHLNALAENELIDLYYVEHIPCIDVAFVEKYYNRIDVGTLVHCTKDAAVSNFILAKRNG